VLFHLNLHLHHVLRHGCLHLFIVRLNVEHHTLLKLVIADSFLFEELIVNPGLLDEHVDHHIHLTDVAGLHLPLNLSLLCQSVHRVLLGKLEGLQSLLLGERGGCIGFIGILIGELTLLSCHQLLLVHCILRHNLHRHLKLFCGRVHFLHHLIHKDLTLLVVQRKFLCDEITVLLFIPFFVEHQTTFKRRISVHLAALTARQRNEVEELE